MKDKLGYRVTCYVCKDKKSFDIRNIGNKYAAAALGTLHSIIYPGHNVVVIKHEGSGYRVKVK